MAAGVLQAKQGADLHTGTFVQMVADDICQRGLLRQYVNACARSTAADATMLEALEEHWPAGTSWPHPRGGLFLWARSGAHQYPGFSGEGDRCQGDLRARLCLFSNVNEEMINEDIYRLGVAMKEELARN